MNPLSFERISIIGLGLIGSSLARAIHVQWPDTILTGYDANEIAMAYARKHHIVDIAITDAGAASVGSELIILATPPSTLEKIVKIIAPHLAQGALVMDVASVKLPAMAAIAPHMPPHATYIPAHPIAGSQLSGISAGSAQLFQGKRVIITPPQPPSMELMQRLSHFWKSLGATLEAMPPELHDRVYAYVSHLPQCLAFALPAEVKAANPGAFTRLCASSAPLWAEIFSLNKENLATALNRYLDVATHILQELETAPADAPTSDDKTLATSLLFPRVAASCLITTVMEAEKRDGVSYARFAGTGFADFASPATTEPEGDLERISTNHYFVKTILAEYQRNLLRLLEVLESGSNTALQAALH